MFAELGEFFPVLNNTPQRQREIEIETSNFFNELFQNHIELDEFKAQMTRFRTSGSKRENEIYACLIYHLIDEFNFFEDYPEPFLITMSKLYGYIIKENLTDGKSLEIAKSVIIICLKNRSQKIFQFAISAMEIFEEEIHKFSEQFKEIFTIPRMYHQQYAILQRIYQVISPN